MMATFHQTEQLLPRLNGMRNNIYLTILVLRSIYEELPEFREARGTFTLALEEYLAAPFLADSIDTNEVSLFVQECRIIERINMRYLIGTVPKVRDKDIESLKCLIPKAIERANRLIKIINANVNRYQLLTQSVND